MTLRTWAIILAVLAGLVAAGAAYAGRSWMPLIMATPIVLIVLFGAARRPSP